MEETLITFVSTYLLDQDPADGVSDHHGSHEHLHVEGPSDELLLDFVPYAHDGFVPLRDRAFSWDIQLGDEEAEQLTLHPHLVFEPAAHQQPGQGLGIAQLKLILPSKDDTASGQDTMEITSDSSHHLDDELDEEAILTVTDPNHHLDIYTVKEEANFLDEEASRPTVTSSATTSTTAVIATTTTTTTARTKRTVRARSSAVDNNSGGSYRTPDVKRERHSSSPYDTHAQQLQPPIPEFTSTGRPTRRAVLSRSSSADYAYGKSYQRDNSHHHGNSHRSSGRTSSANNSSSKKSGSGGGNGGGNSSTMPSTPNLHLSSSTDTPSYLTIGLLNGNKDTVGYNGLSSSSSHSKCQQAAFRPPGMKSALSILQQQQLQAQQQGLGSASGGHSGTFTGYHHQSHGNHHGSEEGFRIHSASTGSGTSSVFPSSSIMNATASATQQQQQQLALLPNDGEYRVGIYTVDERRSKIDKFRERKRQRIWRKQIKYDCRKRLADNRPRVKGRFVSRKNLGKDGKDINGGGNEEDMATPRGGDGDNFDDDGMLGNDDSDADSIAIPTNTNNTSAHHHHYHLPVVMNEGVGIGIMMSSSSASSTMRIVPPPLYPKHHNNHSSGHQSHSRPTSVMPHNNYITAGSNGHSNGNGNSYQHISYQQYQMMQQQSSSVVSSSSSLLSSLPPSLLLPQPTLQSSLLLQSQQGGQGQGQAQGQGQSQQQQVSQVEDIHAAKRTKTF